MQTDTNPETAAFDREPFSPTGPRSKGSGGSRWALLGCGAVILLLGIGSVVFLLKAKDLFAWMMDELESEIMQSLPADLTETEKSELSAAFDAAVEAVREDRASPVDLQGLQRLLREALQDGSGRLSREDVQELIEALERVSGRSPVDESISARPQQETDPRTEEPSTDPVPSE